eukprot:7572631-Pyramimonas_sp.AAC.1
MRNGTTVRVVVGYQLQCAVPENGWPQTGRRISGALADRGQGSREGQGRTSQGGRSPHASPRARR